MIMQQNYDSHDLRQCSNVVVSRNDGDVNIDNNVAGCNWFPNSDWMREMQSIGNRVDRVTNQTTGHFDMDSYINFQSTTTAGAAAESHDRISYLPQDVIYIILSRVPLLDAVRTSVLSAKWKLHWTWIECLVLDKKFFKSIFDHLQADDKQLASQYVRIVGNILQSHNGRIRKFALHFPNYLDLQSLQIINQWMFNISRCGVEDLTLDLGFKFNGRVRSYQFQSMTLTNLSMKCVTLPPSLRQLSSIRRLDLKFGIISGRLLNDVVMNCPQLQRFSLSYNTYLGSLVINASKLEYLCVKYFFGLNLVLENTPKLSEVSLQKRIPNDRQYTKCQSMSEFFNAAPLIETLTITGDILAEWGEADVPKKLLTIVENHENLSVRDLDLYSTAQVCSLFCLINSSPKLQKLEIEVHQHCHKSTEETMNYLGQQLAEVKNIWSFRTLKVSSIEAQEAEKVFIRIFLSRCPVLEKLYLNRSRTFSRFSFQFNMLADIKQCPATSSKLHIIS